MSAVVIGLTWPRIVRSDEPIWHSSTGTTGIGRMRLPLTTGGLGRVDAWVRAGRPQDQFLPSVAVYLRRVLRDSGLCEGSEASRIRLVSRKPEPASSLPATLARSDGTQFGEESPLLPPNGLISIACSAPDHWVGASPAGYGSRHFTEKLDQALRLAIQRARQNP